jgi:TetR/AcrR family transcriptional regulator
VAVRDGERTREAILACAEDLFARQGFEGTSMQQVGEAAGVARSTPSYFFQSKEALYEAVLARAVARAEHTLAARANNDDEHRSPEGAVESFVNALVDLLSRDQNLLLLIQRESLGDGSRVTEFLRHFADDAVAAVAPAAERAGISPQRLVLDLVALCWYPLAHEHTLLPALGLNPREDAFLAEQRRHLAALVSAMTRAKEMDEPPR